jgi:hypothetical protein
LVADASRDSHRARRDHYGGHRSDRRVQSHQQSKRIVACCGVFVAVCCVAGCDGGLLGAAPVAANASKSSGTIALPALHEVKFADGNPVVTVLSVNIEPLDADRRAVTFHLRYSNTGRFDANFWDRSFRLIVDGVPRPPTNRLNELVANDSAKDGDVVFEVPVGVKDVLFQITAGEEKSRLAFKLP